jgi:hypothetical protein
MTKGELCLKPDTQTTENAAGAICWVSQTYMGSVYEALEILG